MKLTVLLLPERDARTVELEKGADGFQLLKALGQNPESVVIFRAERPIPVDSRMRPNDELKVVRVVSGG
jgi:sulfur carrier protein ThiS